MNEEDKIERIIKEIAANYGPDKVGRGDEEPPLARISTKSLELDHATGGGIPIGRWTRFYGPSSSGKSIKCWHTIAEAQSMGLTCAYYNAEKQYTEEFAQKQGVDTNKLIIVQSSVIEEIGEILEGTLEDIDVHVIDSCSQCASSVELADGLNEREYYALHAKRWGQQFRFANERFDQNRNVVILVDQIRTKGIGGRGMAFDGPPGGRAMEHISSLTVEFSKGGWLFYNADGELRKETNSKQKTLSGRTEADGQELKALVQKSRVCRPLRTANMKLDLNKLEFDLLDEEVKAAKHFGVVDDSSSGWIRVDGEDKAIRPKEFRKRIEADPELRERIWNAAIPGRNPEII